MVNSKNQFISQSSDINKLLKKAVIASKRRPVVMKDIVKIMDSAYAIDPHFHQNVITSVENMGYFHAESNSAANLCLGTLRCISKHDLYDAIELGYSIPRFSLDNRIHREMIRLHNKLGYYAISAIHLDCIDDDWANSMREVNKDKQDNTSESKQYLIFKHLAITIRDSLQPEKTPDHEELEDPLTIRGNPIFDIPNICIKKRPLLKRMIVRDLHVKYQKSILGWFWAVIEPLALTLTFLFLFEVLSSKPEQYRPLNIMIGVIVWGSFGHLMNRGTKFLEGNAAILQKVNIPKQIFLLNIAGTAMFTLAINLLAIVPLLFYYKLIPNHYFLYLPLSMLLISIYGISLTLFTSTLQTKWRDVNQFVVVAVRIGFYFSPVFYTMQMLAESRIPSEYLTAYLLINPIAVFLTMARSAFTSAPLGVDTWIVIASIIHVLILYVVGSYWFRKNENEAVKYL